MGDTLPNPFTIHFTADPVAPAQDRHHRGARFADWAYLTRDEGLTAWWLSQDTLRVYSVMYGWTANMSLTGRPTLMAGTASASSHMGRMQVARLRAERQTCADSVTS